MLKPQINFHAMTVTLAIESKHFSFELQKFSSSVQRWFKILFSTFEENQSNISKSIIYHNMQDNDRNKEDVDIFILKIIFWLNWRQFFDCFKELYGSSTKKNLADFLTIKNDQKFSLHQLKRKTFQDVSEKSSNLTSYKSH